MKNNENNSANNFELAPAAAPPASAAVVAAETATAAGNAANEAQNQAVAAALAATEAQNQARTLAAGAAAADVAKAAAEAALKYANKPIKLEHFPKSPEEPQTKIGQIKKCLNWIKELATKKRDDKFLGWFAGSSSGVITLKEWMDWLKNSALYGFIFKYSIIDAPSSDYDFPTEMVIAGKWGIKLVGLFLLMQFVALILLSFNQSKRKHWFFGLVALIILGLVILGVFYGMIFYFQSNKG